MQLICRLVKLRAIESPCRELSVSALTAAAERSAVTDRSVAVTTV